MIDRISQHPELQSFLAQTCEERKYSVNMADDITPGRFIVIKVDKYYHKQGLPAIPPAVDCLIALKCSDGSFMLYLIELKNIKRPRGFTSGNVYQKFKVTIEDFMSERFKEIFLDRNIKIKAIRLFFVTNPYRWKGKEISHRREGTKMEALLNRPSFKFGNQICQIKHKLPNPTIQSC